VSNGSEQRSDSHLALSSWTEPLGWERAEMELTPPQGRLVLVVGFDGSQPAQRALRLAERLLDHRQGWLEVIYVAHVPAIRSAAAAVVDAEAAAELERSLDETSENLSREVRSLLAAREQRWQFRRRDGSKDSELIAAANEARNEAGPGSTVAIVVGNEHRTFSSVPGALTRRSPYPLIVVP
jgi:nucleotide-binding universal stress UspA family protein